MKYVAESEHMVMKLKDLKIGNFEKYVDIKYSKDSMPELVRKSKEDAELELENINEGLKELHYYQYCNKEKDEECEHCHCIYSVLWLGSEFKVTCGRKSNLKTNF